ncbi:class I adenylate-forming enzyme family protein [Sphingomonas sp. Root720]|uniref:class I adenylate-forming enzyme family protein n=1 Tax=Sphingomonas sp. Root720 TaxID=1736595 RepID=UPI001F3BAD18|nr:AMP-binding protein [Sphingomonas sp. Root720]
MFGDRTAVIAGEHRLSFAEIDRQSAYLAGALTARRIVPGDRVTLYGENSWEWIVAYYGIARAGAVINPVNMLLTPQEVRYIVDDCDVGTVIASPSKLADLVPALSGSGVRIMLSYADIPELIAEEMLEPNVARSENDLATIAYTSGTTGRPKGALLTHRSIVTNVRMTAVMHGRSANDIIVTALPLPHVYGNVVMSSTVLSGATLVLHTRFEAGTILDSIAAHRATMLEGVPTMYHYLLQSPALAQADLSSLRLCTVGGQTMPVSVMETVEARFGCPLIELWGMTELGGLGTTHPHTGPRRHGSIGVPLPFMEARIDAPEEGVGELLVRGAMVMQGYHNAPELTCETIDPDGWLRTGDLARIDGQGFIFVVDRKKDMILTAGNNIYPAELERVIAMHPGVAFSAVAGLPDAAKGEVPVAFIVPRAGATLSAHEMDAHCRLHLAPYKVPRAYRFVDDLPKTSTGKIMRRALAELSTDNDTIARTGS